MEFDFNQLRELLHVLNQTDIAELSFKSQDFELNLRKMTESDRSGSVIVAPVDSLPQPTAPIPTPPTAPSNNSTPTPPPASDPKWVEIMAPMVGTFYRAPAPDEPPYINVGDRIRAGQTVCIIEAMKLMNEIEAEMAGEIVEILVENGDPVEYGQPLIRVNPG